MKKMVYCWTTFRKMHKMNQRKKILIAKLRELESRLDVVLDLVLGLVVGLVLGLVCGLVCD